jgi:hypothetical protein
MKNTPTKSSIPAKAGTRPKDSLPRKTGSATLASEHHAHMRRANANKWPDVPGREPLVVVKNSKIHGRGVYAARRIRKGTRVIEYLGERISHAVADARYDEKADDGHTFLFVVDDDICIDAGVGGNPARFINHKCDANCETIIENKRVFIEALRTIEPGEELGYDYQLTWESTDDPEELKLYACRCGAAACRGTMLDVKPLDVRRKEEAAQKRKAARVALARAAARKTAAAAGRTRSTKTTRKPAGRTGRASRRAGR